MGMLWDLIQKHIDNSPYPPSERQVARRLGVAPNTFKSWRDLRRLPTRENLEAIAALVGVRYSVVLDAALMDTGYHESVGRVAVLVPRPESVIEAELRAAEADLADFTGLGLEGGGMERKRGELVARVDALKAELRASQSATLWSGSVTKS